MREHKRYHITRSVLIGVLAFSLVLGAGIGTAWAYFTTFATAKGHYTLNLGDTTEIVEKVTEGKKEVNIKVTKDSQPVFVRVKGICDEQYTLVYNAEFDKNDKKIAPISDLWEEGSDGYWYYKDPVGPEVDEDGKLTDGMTKEGLIISIREKDGDNKDGKKIDATNLEDGHQFNIIVYYETVPVKYDANGTETKADWNKEVTVRKTITPTK